LQYVEIQQEDADAPQTAIRASATLPS